MHASADSPRPQIREWHGQLSRGTRTAALLVHGGPFSCSYLEPLLRELSGRLDRIVYQQRWLPPSTVTPVRQAGELLAALAALAAPEGRADPYPLYDRLRALGRAVVAPDGTPVFTGYRDCSALLRDHRLGKAPKRMLTASGYPDWQDRPSLRLMFTSILMLNPPAHTRLRRLVSAAFTARRVQGLRPPCSASWRRRVSRSPARAISSPTSRSRCRSR